MVQCRKLNTDEITTDLFRTFLRRQIVTDCWRKEDCLKIIVIDYPRHFMSGGNLPESMLFTGLLPV